MGAHITALLKKRQSLLLKTHLIAWKASSGLKVLRLNEFQKTKPDADAVKCSGHHKWRPYKNPVRIVGAHSRPPTNIITF
jgi:hypothetical protein